MAKAIEDAIAALEKKPASTKPGTSDKSPQTGATSNLALWIALLFVSGGAATVSYTHLTITKSKRERTSLRSLSLEQPLIPVSYTHLMTEMFPLTIRQLTKQSKRQKP